MKIAFDEHVPTVLVKVFETFATARGFKKIVGGTYEIKIAKDYAPKPGDADYIRKNDVP